MKVWHFVVIALIVAIAADLFLNDSEATRMIQRGFADTVGQLVN
jgi:hypothetical protein